MASFPSSAQSSFGPEGAVYAIEPLPLNVRQIEHNVRLNNFRNVGIMKWPWGGQQQRQAIGFRQLRMSRLADIGDAPDKETGPNRSIAHARLANQGTCLRIRIS